MEAWSIVKAVNSGLRAVGLSTGPLGAIVNGPVGMAVGTTLMIKKWVDSENTKVFEAVRQREGCPHITMLEGAPPTPSAVLYVANYGGVAWKVSGASIYFHHKDTIFKPLLFSEAFLQGPNGVKSAKSSMEFEKASVRPKGGYGCSECKKASDSRK